MSENKPSIKDIIFSVFRIVYLNKLVGYEELIKPDGIECYLFHLFADLGADEPIPTVADIVEYIISRD